MEKTSVRVSCAGLILTYCNYKIPSDEQPHEFSTEFHHFRLLLCTHHYGIGNLLYLLKEDLK